MSSKPKSIKKEKYLFYQKFIRGASAVVQWVQAPVKPDHLRSTCRAHVEETKNWLTPVVLLASTVVAQ